MEIDYSRKWRVMAAVGSGVFLATVDGSIVNVALPTLVADLQTDFAAVQWVVLAYLLTLTTLLLAVGRLADMIGKKPIYAAGFVVFTLGSALCGLAPTIWTLVAFRVIQAVGAAMILALGMAIVTEAFPSSERGRALGVSGAIVSIGIVVGPTLGGLILAALSWHWVFFVNLPVGAIGVWMVLRYVPNLRPPGGQRFDYLGAVTLFVSLLCLLLALTGGQRLGFADGRILGLLGVSLVFMIAFVLLQTRLEQPMVDLQLFRDNQFSVGLLTALATFVAISGTTLLMPFYLQNVLGYDTRQVGLLLAIVPLGLGLTAPISGALSDRLGSRPITAAGLSVLLIGYLLMSSLGAETSPAEFFVRFLPLGIGMGIFQSPNNSAIMGAAPRQRLGVVSGTLAISRSLGQTTGIALLGAIWAGRTALYAPGDLPGGAAQAPAAAQVAGLHDAFLVVIILIALALALSLYGLYRASQAPASAAARAAE
jgi:EmrB/QacA subfamily drug resistance transporter